MNSENRLIELMKTGKVNISTTKLELFLWEDMNGEWIFEIVKNTDGLDDEACMEAVKNPFYQGTSFKKALKYLEESIK